MIKRVLLAALLGLAVARPLRAQESPDDKKAAVLEEARQHVAKAKVHYDLGEFKEAAEEYTIVYRIRPITALLFNIAQAYRQGGLYEKAKQFYKSYLREAPDAKNKATIEQAIREMDELLAKEKRTKEAAPTGVKETAEASLPLTPGGAAPAKGAETPKPGEPAKPADATKPGEAAKPGTIVAMTTPLPRAPAGATPGTTAPRPQPVVEEEGGILTKWWFWTAVGAVAVGAGAAALTMGGNSAPSSHFGTNGI